MSANSRHAWFHLYDTETGQAFKNSRATKILITLPAAPVDLDDYVEAVMQKYKQEGSSILAGLSASQLSVYKNKDAFDKRNATVGKVDPLNPSDLLNANLGQKDGPLVIAVPYSQVPLSALPNLPPPSSIPEKLKQLDVSYSTKDLNYIIATGGDTLTQLMLPTLTKDVAQTVLTSVKSKVKSSTQQAIGSQYSFFLDGSLGAGKGQAKSSLYYAFSESGGVVVAKVYNGHHDDFQREVNISNELDHPNIVKSITSFSIQKDGETRNIIIMPFFPRSVADMLLQHSGIPLAAIIVIARDCFDALCHLHSKGYCFADLKPSNIMLRNALQGHATLVDFGATVRIGDRIIEITKNYCLDVDTSIASESLDWICLGTTLAQIGGFQIYNYNTINDLVNDVINSSQNPNIKRLIISCLQNPSLSNIASSINSNLSISS